MGTPESVISLMGSAYWISDFARFVNQVRKESRNVIAEKIVENVRYSYVLDLLVEVLRLESKWFNSVLGYPELPD